jgi:hypothetical protein
VGWLNNPQYGEAGVNEATRRRREAQAEGLDRRDRRPPVIVAWHVSLDSLRRLAMAARRATWRTLRRPVP